VLIAEKIYWSFRQYLEDSRRWAEGRFPFFRLMLLLVLAWSWYNHLKDPRYQSVFFGLNFGIHELGHFVFAPLGQFMMILGGSLFQCLVPLIGLAMFLYQGDRFGVAFSFGWEATNIYYVATYTADARAMKLPLLTPFGKEAYHDWNWLLSRTGLLKQDILIASAFRILASLCMIICLFYGGWLVYRMLKSFRRNWGSG